MTLTLEATQGWASWVTDRGKGGYGWGFALSDPGAGGYLCHSLVSSTCILHSYVSMWLCLFLLSSPMSSCAPVIHVFPAWLPCPWLVTPWLSNAYIILICPVCFCNSYINFVLIPPTCIQLKTSDYDISGLHLVKDQFCYLQNWNQSSLKLSRMSIKS